MAMLNSLQQDSLDARDRVLHPLVKDFVQKRVRDGGRTAGINAGILQKELEQLTHRAEREAAAGTREGSEPKAPGDYLWAEALGYRVEEWRNLFVPKFLATSDLLAKNITVLTGARGCGKTMSFRRITRLMDIIAGPSGVVGADQFVGFYLNCRDLVDAFPWVQRTLQPGGQQQVIHFFHLAWLAEICNTLASEDLEETQNYTWLEDTLASYFRKRYVKAISGSKLLAHLRAFIETEKEITRVTRLGSLEGPSSWPLCHLDVLDGLRRAMAANIPWLSGGIPLYFFLDDYTLRLMPRAIQSALNPIIFKTPKRALLQDFH